MCFLYVRTVRTLKEGLKGFLKEGGSKRREATQKLVESVSGTLEAYYFAFCDNDFYVIVEVPDNVSAAAGSPVANDSGTVKIRTVLQQRLPFRAITGLCSMATLNRHALRNDLKYFDSRGMVKNSEKGIQAGFGPI